MVTLHRCSRVFSSYTHFMVGGGVRTRFEDLWGRDHPLCSQFSCLYKVVTVKNLYFLFFIIILFIGKEKPYIKKRGNTKNSVVKVYSKSLMAQPKGEGKRAKKITCPYLELNQSMKLTREISLVSTNTLDQDHRLHTKEIFNL